MAWWKRGQKPPSVKKEVGAPTVFPTTPTRLVSTPTTGTGTVGEVTSPSVPKSQSANASQPGTFTQVLSPTKTDVLHGEPSQQKGNAMSKKIQLMISDEAHAALLESVKGTETVNDAVRRLLNKSLKISNKK